MIDNFEQIGKILEFNSEDDFYHLQIISRRKDNPEIHSNSISIRHYYIISKEHLENLKGEIIVLCKYHNARAGINLNRRSFEKIGFHTLKKLTDQIMNKDFRSMKQAYSSVAGTHSNEKNKKWIIDVDVKDLSVVEKIINEIEDIEPVGDKYITTLETKNGYHLIVKPFNTHEYNKVFNMGGCDVHKDNPSILYIP